MHKSTSLAQMAVGLLSIDPVGAGITLDCGSIRIYLDEKDGAFTGRIERVVLPAVFATCADETALVARLWASNLPGLLNELDAKIQEKLRDSKLSIDRLFYRKSKFANFERVWPVDSGTVALRHSKWWRWLQWLPFPAPLPVDEEFEKFLKPAIDRAFNWGRALSRFAEMQLWFQGTACSSAYFKISKTDDGVFIVRVEDRLCWPWREEKLLERVKSVELAKDAIRDYMSRTHGFEFNSMFVSFFHTPELSQTELAEQIPASAPENNGAAEPVHWAHLPFMQNFLNGLQAAPTWRRPSNYPRDLIYPKVRF